MPAPLWVALLYAAVVVLLGGVYVWSRDAGRRTRALRLLRILVGRR